jgi:4-hydroxyphenylacetate 3-monooxygenase
METAGVEHQAKPDAEAARQIPAGLNSSGSYRDRLNDGRRIELNGRRLADVASASEFDGAISIVEEYYRLQAQCPELHMAAQDGGGLIPRSLKVPRDLRDLQDKRRSYKETADLSSGMLGRTPDFMNAASMAVAAHSSILGSDRNVSYAENARDLYARCCAENLFIAHGAINAQFDKTRPPGMEDHPFAGVRILDHDSSGITIKGAKKIVTLGALADELMIFNMPGLAAGDEDRAVACVIRINSPRLTLFCRKPFHEPGHGLLDYPLTNRLDEVDCLAVMDEVHVPWGRVLVFRDVGKSNAFYDRSFARNHTGHQGIVRGLAKAEFTAGVALALAELYGSTGIPSIQEQLGEVVSWLEITKALIERAESSAVLSDAGVLTPNILAIQATRMHFPRMYERTLQLIRSLAPGDMFSTPCAADLSGANAALLLAALGDAKNDARTRVATLNLAWDLSASAFGQRQLSYEYYHAGDPGRISAGQFKAYGWNEERAAVQRGMPI